MNQLQASELILNHDGSIYHLHLLPAQVSETIILVGDQGRVGEISKYFDKIDVKVQNREFLTHTGEFKGKKITVLSTGIGTDNIDIVVNELDALVNIDLANRTLKEKHTTLKLVRIGTSGALQPDIPVDNPVASFYSCGFDGLLNFYAGRESFNHAEMEKQFLAHTNWNPLLAKPYFVKCSEKLFNQVAFDMIHGITIAAPGFYGPQGRVLRLPLADPALNDKIAHFKFNNLRFSNFEMESSAIYGLSALLGHESLTVCNIIANRMRKEFSKDYKKSLEKIIVTVLERLITK